MADRQQIEFIIKSDGTVEERVTGVRGPECERVTDAIEEALGTTTHRERTSDYWQANETRETITTSS